MKNIFPVIKEYISYLKKDWKLIFSIPRRFFEELVFNLQFSYARFNEIITGKTRFDVIKKSLLLMLEDMQKADLQYKPALIWQRIFDYFIKVLYVEGLKNFKGGRINDRFARRNSKDTGFFNRFLWLYHVSIKEIDIYGLLGHLEEPKLGNNEVMLIEKKRISHDLLQSLDEFYTIDRCLPQSLRKHPIVLELGAGYGRLPFVFLNAYKNITYIVVDLPGSLAISEYYLTSLFGKKQVLTYEGSRGKILSRKNIARYKLIFLSPWDFVRLPSHSVDIFINIYSFQEMKISAIKNYFGLIDRISRWGFYTKQFYKSINPNDNIEINKSDYPIKKHWKEIFTRTSKVDQTVFESLYEIGSSFRTIKTPKN